jgi:TatD DNase family protein
MPWIDVHTHLNMLDRTPEQALAEARRVGVERVITIGTEPQDLPVVLKLAETLAPAVFCTLGVHPHEAELLTPDTEQFIRTHAGHPRVVALGEMGLDYYYDNAPRELQQQVFRRQLQMAVEYDLPVEIHTRDAEEDTVAILREFDGRVRGLFHCFTGTQWLADRGLELGLNISISGVVTFKNAEALREVVKTVPLERLHVETDAPFLAPVPHRGQKNHPALILHTAQMVANLKNISLDELAKYTLQNSEKLFSKLQ